MIFRGSRSKEPCDTGIWGLSPRRRIRYRDADGPLALGRPVTVARRLLLFAPAAVLLLAALLPVSFSTPFPLCAVKALTGADCPGCGLTRAFLLIAHGRLAAAAAVQPLGVPAFLILAGVAIAGAVRAARGR